MSFRTETSIGVLLGLCLAVSAQAQQQPVVDSSTQASPVKSSSTPPATDSSVDSSPLSEPHRGGQSISPQKAIAIKLSQSIDSGRLKNGQTVHAILSSSVRTTSGSLPVGTPVELTVIATIPAGKIHSYGEFSLQLLRVGPTGVLTDVQTFRGKIGHKVLPDSAPAVGTNAALASGAALTFHVQSQPVAASGPPGQTSKGPGSIDGVASGKASPVNAQPR